MWSLAFRNLLFTLLQPGLVAGLIPYWILGNRAGETFNNPLNSLQYIAILIFAAGTAILIYCIIMFAIKGKVTLSPADPTTDLVVSGLYRFSRNPMYIGLMLMLVGEAIFFFSVRLWIYTAFVFIAVNFFVIFHEEPRLKRDFGAEYRQYLKTVRRWL